MDMAEDKPQAGWAYKPDGQTEHQPEHLSGPQPHTDAAKAPHEKEEVVTWTASEFIAHQKSFGWYVMLMLVGLALASVVYLVTKDMITVGVIILCFLVFGIAAGRKPRVLPYRLDRSGLTIGQKLYPYGHFKAFAVIDEGTFSSIVFLPLKRFMPALSIYFAPEDEDRILDTLSLYLPLEQGKLDLFETIVRRIRF